MYIGPYALFYVTHVGRQKKNWSIKMNFQRCFNHYMCGSEIEKLKKPLSSKRRKWLLILLLFIVFGLLSLIALDFYVSSCSKGMIYHSIDDLPHKNAALVLGCSRTTNGRINLYYQYRIDAAAELWEKGKIDAIVVSGDNSRKDYDEPTGMKADLVQKGIPAEFITIDYAGFSTLDSVIRAEKIFGLKDYTIVSQPFHCSRAVYLAGQHGQSAIGYSARDISGASGIKIRLREILARTKAVCDILTSRSPEFLGRSEQVNYRERIK